MKRAFSSIDPRLDWLASGHTLLVPTRRLAFHLRRLYGLEAERQGLDVWPTADIVTWPDWIERLFRERRETIPNPPRWLSASASRLVWDAILRRDDETQLLLFRAGLAAVVQRSWQRLHEYGLAGDSIDTSAGTEQAAFARWLQRYVAWLGDENWIDVSLAPNWIEPASLANTRVGVTGFDTLTPQQQQFLASARKAGGLLPVLQLPATEARTVRTACTDRASEYDAAARWCAAKVDEAPQLRLAIVVEDLRIEADRVRRSLDRVLTPAAAVTGGPRSSPGAYSVAVSRELAARPMVSSALAMLAMYAARSAHDSAADLLRDPFVGGAGDEATSRAALDARMRRQSGRTITLEFLAAASAAADAPLLAGVLNGALARRATWPAVALPSHWAGEFAGLLDTLGWPAVMLDSVEHQTRERWFELLATLGTCDVISGRIAAAEAVRLLRTLADDAQFEPEQADTPVLVTDARSCAGMQFDALWICGLDASRWPAAAQPDPFLPWHLQQQLQIDGTTAAACATEAATTFARLQRSAAEVVASHPQTERDAELLPSPLLEGIAPRPPTVDWPVATPTRVLFDARPELERRIDTNFPPLTPGSEVRGGAAMLEHQSACPFRAQAMFRLQANALEQPAIGLDPATRGRLVHAVLERVWSELRTSDVLAATDADAIEALLDRSIGAAVSMLHGPRDPVFEELLLLETRWLRARVIELLELDRTRADFSVVERESTRVLELAGLRLNLRLDRVDELATGELAIIDYKTSRHAEPRSWSGERPESPQLPAYALAVDERRVAAVAFAGLRAGDTRYAGLSRLDVSWPGLQVAGSARRGKLTEFTTWETMLALWRRRIEALMREFCSGLATLAPDRARACRRCHLAALCRVNEHGPIPDPESGEDDADVD